MSISRPDRDRLAAVLDRLEEHLKAVTLASHPLTNAAGLPVTQDDGSWIPDLTVDLRVVELHLQVYDRRAALLNDPPPDLDTPGGM